MDQKPTSTSVKAWGYARASTEDQRLTIEAQRERITAGCQMKGLDLIEVFTDAAVSGSRMLKKRPGGRMLYRALKTAHNASETGLVVFCKLDRCFRGALDALTAIRGQWEPRGFMIHSLDEGLDTSTPHGRLMLTMLSGFAEMEREQIQLRTRKALDHLKKHGRRTNYRAPWGHRFEGDLVVEDEREQEALRMMIKLRGEGLTTTKISDALYAAGYRGREDNKLSARSISRILIDNGHRQRRPRQPAAIAW